MFRDAFIKTRNYYGITAKQIHELSGVSQNHISEYQGGKRDVTGETLWRMVQAMEDLAPGAKRFFASELLGCQIFSPQSVASQMSNAETAEFLSALADKIRESDDTKRTLNREKVVLMSS